MYFKLFFYNLKVFLFKKGNCDLFITEELRTHIDELLHGLKERTDWMKILANRVDPWQKDLTFRLAAERALHTSAEYMTDICSLIIDALVMRDPGGYADMIQVLVEEGVLRRSWFQQIEGLFEFRARCIRNHAELRSEEVHAAILAYANHFDEFSSAISSYLNADV